MGLRFTVIPVYGQSGLSKATSEEVRRYLAYHEPNMPNKERKLAIKVASDSGSWVSYTGIYVELEKKG